MPGTDIEPRARNLPAPVPGTPQRKRESEALPAKALRSARRNRAVSVPLSLPLPVWTAAEIMHAYGLVPEVAVTGGAAAGTLAVWLFAPHKWDRAPEVWYARATAACFSGWLTAAAFLGPVSASGAPLAGSLAVLCAAWGVPWYRHYRVRGRKDRENFRRKWQAWWDGHSLAWANGSNAIDVEDMPFQVRIRIQLIGGRQSLETLKTSVHLIESAVPTGRGMVRVAEVGGNASQADVFVKFANPLKGTVEWDPSLAPSSVHGDAVIGMSETGQWVRVPMRTSAFVNGKTRSGKGNHLLLRLVQLSGCPDDRQVVIDLKQRAARTLLRTGGLEYVITTVEEARAYLMMLRAERAARARDADTEEEQLLATEATPAIHTLIDETHPLTSEMAGDAACARLLALLAAEGAGLEEYVEVYTQYGALAESVQTEQTRSNLPLRACYAVESAGHGTYALGDGGGDASKLQEKGELLMKLGPRARQEKLRAPHMPFSLFLEIVSANAARLRRRPLHLYCGNEPSAVPGQTWQEWWDRRFLRIDPAFRKDSPQYQAALEEFGEPQQAAAPAPLVRPYLAPAPPVAEDSGAAVSARIAAETAGPDVPSSPEVRARATEIYEQSRDRFFALLAAAPPEGVRTADLIEMSGMSNGQAYKVLGLLAERGAVTQPGRGLCAPVPGRDAAAEYAAIRAGSDALGRRAARHLAAVGR